MNIRLPSRAQLLDPLHVAGYVTWVAVSASNWRSLPQHAWAAGVLLAFLLGFLASRVYRHAALVTMIAASFSLMALGPADGTPILLIIVAGMLASAYGARTSWIILAVDNLAFLVVLSFAWRIAHPFLTLFIYGSFQVFAVVTAGASARAQAAAEQFRRVNAELLATRALLAESARDAERLRVSRELHDVAGHHLTALSLNLDALAHGAAPRRELLVARELTAELLADIRSVVTRLRHDDGIDLREALRRIVESFPRPNIHWSLDDKVRIHGAERADAVIRACQEGLTNAVRHAEASGIWLTVMAGDGVTELVVEDDGVYSGAHKPGNGLSGMQERLAQVGGTVTTTRGDRGGFRLAVRVPS